jgi:hypothetical protein
MSGKQMNDPQLDVWLLWLYAKPCPYASKVYTDKDSPLPLSEEEKRYISLSVKLKPEEYNISIAALEQIYPYVRTEDVRPVLECKRDTEFERMLMESLDTILSAMLDKLK